MPRHLRREVPERLAADGTVLVPLDLDAVDRESDVARRARRRGDRDLLPARVREPGARARRRRSASASAIPRLDVTASHEVATEWREYERTSTTVLNAYVQPLFAGYVERLEARLARRGYTRPLALMQSNGGVISARGRAARRRSGRSSRAPPAA